MSQLYLIRHGQAGDRLRYDTLSELGRRQARLLGGHLAARKIVFQAVYAGALVRHRETAAEVRAAYREAGLDFPETIVEPDWNEFDLDAVYRDVAPALSAADPKFRSDYEELLRLIRDETAAIHHTWSPCDVAVVRAWVNGTHPAPSEPWTAFQERVCRPMARLCAQASGDAVAVFTSATPIAVWMARALGIRNGVVMRLAGVQYNTAITTMRIQGSEALLFSFNGVEHLPSELRTFR